VARQFVQQTSGQALQVVGVLAAGVRWCSASRETVLDQGLVETITCKKQ